jgi:formylglycine-generating enzyme required for sulfatase activity
MKRHIAVILGLCLTFAASVSQGEWKMRIHHGATVEERVLAAIDSLTFYNDPSMVLIPPGTFTMGSPPNEPGHGLHEIEHPVTLTRPFFVSRREVTQAEWQAVMGWNESYFPGPNRPVEIVTWFDCLSYCNRRSAAEGLDSVYVMTGRAYDGVHIVGAGSVGCFWLKNGYRLLTEAEWEYACRAGSITAFCNGPITHAAYDCGDDSGLDLVGWYCCNAGSTTHDAAGQGPNAWGLFDMHGNVYEWCWDWYGDYPPAPVTDPLGVASGSDRVVRGGDWSAYAVNCRSAFRGYNPPDVGHNSLGLRVARTAP